MSYGQFYEDGFIQSLFDETGYAIEVGGGEGVNGSPTWGLEERGWKVLTIEPNPELYKRLKEKRKWVQNWAIGVENEDSKPFEVYTLQGGNQTAISGLQPQQKLIDNHLSLIERSKTIHVDVRTLDVAVYEWGLSMGESIPKIDFVSIDTEGTEMDVVSGFDWNKWKPKLVEIENNFEDEYYAIKMWNYGYVLWNRIGVNDFYLHQDYVPKMVNGAPDLTQSPYYKR